MSNCFPVFTAERDSRLSDEANKMFSGLRSMCEFVVTLQETLDHVPEDIQMGICTNDLYFSYQELTVLIDKMDVLIKFYKNFYENKIEKLSYQPQWYEKIITCMVTLCRKQKKAETISSCDKAYRLIESFISRYRNTLQQKYYASFSKKKIL